MTNIRQDNGSNTQFDFRGRAGGACARGGLVIAKLSEVLFVETLRRYINALPADQTGWLQARVTRSSARLWLLHKEPAHPWIISSLARRVGLSRTRRAERFRHFLENPRWLTWPNGRLKMAAELLQSTEDSESRQHA